jgi:imidazolonepropionase-like amidohydrolase
LAPKPPLVLTWASALLALAAARDAGAAAAGPRPEQAITWVRAGTLIDGTGRPPARDMGLVLKGDRIAEVAPWSRLDPPPGSTVVNLADKTVLPGLVDTHVHLSMHLGPGWEMVPVKTGAADAAILATVNAARTLRAGFTTVRNLGDRDGETVALRNAVDVGTVPGPHVLTARGMLSMTGGHGDWTNAFRPGVVIGDAAAPGVCDSPEACRAAVRTQVKYGADVIKIAATGGVLSAGDAIGARQFSDDELAAIVAEAHALGRKVAAHAHGTEGLKAAVRAGVDSIEHGSILDDEAVRLMKERGTCLVPTLLAGETVEARARSGGLPAWAVEKALAVRPLMTGSFRRALKAGVTIAFGTDSGVSEHGRNAREFELMVEAGMKPMDAIVAATRNAATLLGVAGDRGTIEAGRRADLVAVTGDPLADIGVLAHPVAIFKDGRPIDPAAPAPAAPGS